MRREGEGAASALQEAAPAQETGVAQGEGGAAVSGALPLGQNSGGQAQVVPAPPCGREGGVRCVRDGTAD